MTDDFSNYPKSIGDIRSDKSGAAKDWSPRDALIWVLREIDSGNLDASDVIIITRTREQARNPTDDPFGLRVTKATDTLVNSLGMIEQAKHVILSG